MIDIDQIASEPRHIDAVTEAPAGIENKGILYPKTVNEIVEIFFKDSEGTETQITSNGSLMLPTSPALVPEGGAINSVLSKVSNNDHEMGWKKQNELMSEAYFVLPKAVSIDARIALAGSITGLTLYSADNDPTPDAEFGELPSTLIIKPTGLTGVIMGSVEIMELNEAGDIGTQGWVQLSSAPTYKSNKALDRGAIINLNSILDISRDCFIKVRFFKTVMP